MKKNFKYAMMSAIAFVGVVSFSACSSNEEVVDNPNYNPEDNTVKTQFTISIPSNAAGKTRMSEATVQGQTPPVFRGIRDVVLIPFATTATSTSTRIGPNIDLPEYTISELSANNSKVYSNVALKMGTGAFLFYGEAIPAASDITSLTSDEKFINGIVTPSALTGEPSSFSFSLNQIHSATTPDRRATGLCEYISTIAAANAGDNVTLNTYLLDFKTLKAGSSASILAAVQRLRDKVAATAESTERTNILNAIDNTTYVTLSGTTLSLTSSYTDYPNVINLPDGAAGISWTGNAASPALDMNANGSTASLTSYVYPPSLYYRANSLVRVAESEQSSKYGTKTSWGAVITDLYQTGTVQATTRSVALVDQIQYAVGRMDLTVKAATSLYDRNGEAVTINENGFPVSAVLIGGQKNVDFEFVPKSDSPVYTIYDPKLTDIAAKSNASVGTNHTLVFETAESTTSVQIAIELTNNTTKEFRGVDGVIPVNGKFYLLGTLNLANGVKPKDTSNNEINITKIFLQDYITKVNLTIDSNAEDATNNPDRNKGLGGAFNVLPDLQTPQLELGLSVNLEWQEGMTFNVSM